LCLFLKAFVKALDTNGDKKISLEEYLDYFMQKKFKAEDQSASDTKEIEKDHCDKDDLDL